MEFFESRMGNKFYNGQVPALIEAVKEAAGAIQKSNELKEKELKLKEEETQVLNNILERLKYMR